MKYKFICKNSLCNHEENIQEVNVKNKYKTCPICKDEMVITIIEEDNLLEYE